MSLTMRQNEFKILGRKKARDLSMITWCHISLLALVRRLSAEWFLKGGNVNGLFTHFYCQQCCLKKLCLSSLSRLTRLIRRLRHEESKKQIKILGRRKTTASSITPSSCHVSVLALVRRLSAEWFVNGGGGITSTAFLHILIVNNIE